MKNLYSYIDPHCVSVYVIDRSGHRYLLIRRCGAYLRGTWQMVTGGIHPEEKAWEAAFREVKEETGFIPDRMYSADAVETFYMISRDKIMFVPVFVAFVNAKTEVVLSPEEHDAYEWLEFENARERLVFAEQKRVLAHIHEQFVLREPSELLLIAKP